MFVPLTNKFKLQKLKGKKVEGPKNNQKDPKNRGDEGRTNCEIKLIA